MHLMSPELRKSINRHELSDEVTYEELVGWVNDTKHNLSGNVKGTIIDFLVEISYYENDKLIMDKDELNENDRIIYLGAYLNYAMNENDEVMIDDLKKVIIEENIDTSNENFYDGVKFDKFRGYDYTIHKTSENRVNDNLLLDVLSFLIDHDKQGILLRVIVDSLISLARYNKEYKNKRHDIIKPFIEQNKHKYSEQDILSQITYQFNYSKGKRYFTPLDTLFRYNGIKLNELIEYIEERRVDFENDNYKRWLNRTILNQI